jgi:hypothetical protein
MAFAAPFVHWTVSGEQDLPFKSDEVDPDTGRILLCCAAIFCTAKPIGDARSHSTDSAQPLTGQTMSIAYCGVTLLGAGSRALLCRHLE